MSDQVEIYVTKTENIISVLTNIDDDDTLNILMEAATKIAGDIVRTHMCPDPHCLLVDHTNQLVLLLHNFAHKIGKENKEARDAK